MYELAHFGSPWKQPGLCWVASWKYAEEGYLGNCIWYTGKGDGGKELAVECERKLILPLPGVALRFSLTMRPVSSLKSPCNHGTNRVNIHLVLYVSPPPSARIAHNN